MPEPTANGTRTGGGIFWRRGMWLAVGTGFLMLSVVAVVEWMMSERP